MSILEIKSHPLLTPLPVNQFNCSALSEGFSALDLCTLTHSASLSGWVGGASCIMDPAVGLVSVIPGLTLT